MRTSEARLSRKFVVLCALIAASFSQFAPTSVAVEAPKTQLTAEARTLDKFVDDLFKLDRKRGELGKKASLTRAEFDSVQSSADDLKRRLSEVQNALRTIITKLKDAGEWDDIDSRVVESISDAGTLARFRQTSFKRELEELAANLSSHADEISGPLDSLRKRVSARARDAVFPPARPASAWQAVAVSYHPEPAMVTTGVRCTLSKLRYGVSRLTHGAATAGADEAYKCACNIPSGYSCYSPPTT